MSYYEIYCDDAERQSDGRLYCKKSGEPCKHQYFCMGKGWCKLKGSAMECEMRDDNKI